MKLNEWIRSARHHADMSQEKLGEYLGKSKANISLWESGAHEPSFAQLLKIIEVTGYRELLPGLSAALEKAHWPFHELSLDKVRKIDDRDLIKLETVIQISAKQIGLDVSKDDNNK